MVSAGAGLVAASTEESLATALAGVFIRAGVVCEESNDPTGVELAGVAKNAAALASGATEAQGLNAAGAAAGHIFAEVWRWAEAQGRAARVDDRPGRHRRPRGHRARARDPQPPRRRAARPGRAGERDPGPRRTGRRGAPDRAAARPGAARRRHRRPGHRRARPADQRELPLEDWVEIVRATVPPPPRWRPPSVPDSGVACGSGSAASSRRFQAKRSRTFTRRQETAGTCP